MSGSLVPTAELFDNFYFTPEREPCLARFEYDKALKEEEGFPLVLDVSDFPSYLRSLSRHDKFEQLLQYERIEIVEKEDVESKY